MNLRAMADGELRSYARDAADDVLGRYGYARRRSFAGRALPIVGAVAAGVAIGACVAVLLTPKTGEELRSDITRRAGEVRDNVRGLIEKRFTNGSRASTSSPTARGEEYSPNKRTNESVIRG